MQLLRLLSLIVALCLFPLFSVAASEPVDRIVAVVNGEIITLYELERREAYFFKHYEGKMELQEKQELKEQIRKQILENMIEDILFKQQAQVYNIKVNDSEVNTQIRQVIKEQGLSEDEFSRTLKSEKMTMEDYKDKIRLDILKHRLISGMVRRKVIVTQEEIEAYYDEHKDDYSKDKQITLQLIVFPADVDADILRTRIEDGEISFEQAASEYSIGPGADSGGDIGTVNWQDMAADWRQALDGVEVGKLSDMFQLEGKKALLKVTSLMPGEMKPLGEVEEEISAILRRPRLEERYKEFVADLRDKAVIDIRL